jgi:hypothetical protein
MDTELSLFLTLVLAPGAPGVEGKESEAVSELGDMKGIYCSFPWLHILRICWASMVWIEKHGHGGCHFGQLELYRAL